MNLKERVDVVWEANKTSIEKRLEDWIGTIGQGAKTINKAKFTFHRWKPLRFYMSITRVKAITFAVRFGGQDVAELAVQGDDVLLNISKYTDKHGKNKGHYYTNLRDFGGPDLSGSFEWGHPKSGIFRKYFRANVDKASKAHQPEHTIESRILEEMSKESKSKFGGTLHNIQPILIADKFPLQIPLPISASSGVPHKTSGHIDILARRGVGRSTNISLWELKRPGAYERTLREAYIYAVTLLKVLRHDKYGSTWYKDILKINRKMPDSLVIEISIAITADKKRSLLNEYKTHINDMPLAIGPDKIALYAAFYDKDTLKIDFRPIENL